MKFSEMKYVRFDMNAAKSEMEKLCAEMKTADVQGQLALYRRFSEISESFDTMSALSYVRHTIDTRDEFYDAENDYYDENGPLFTKLAFDFYRLMVASPYRDALERELTPQWFKNIELRLRGFDERIIGEMQQDNALSSEYKKLLASAKIDFDGKVLNLAQIRAYMLSPDREVRKAAYRKRSEFLAANAGKLDDIYDRLVHLRDGMGKKMGFDNYVPLGFVSMNRNCYGPDEVKILRDNVKKYIVPLCGKIDQLRRKMLGLDRLYYYDADMFFPDGNPEPHGTPEEMFENGRRMYSELSPETREFIGFMLENELFDVLAKPGKSGGGYCITLAGFRSPFVFANFNGTSEDVDVLTHECGHALNDYLGVSVKIPELREPTYDVAEIHSMSMEFFTEKWMKLFFGDNADRYIFMHFALALLFLPYGCMVDEFQYEVYSHPDMTPAMRKQLWTRLEAEYGRDQDYDGDEFMAGGGLWQRQSHIYERPFYYIDYVVAQSCALQYRVWMESDFDGAWKDYIELSKKAGRVPLTALLEESELSSPFENGFFEKIVAGSEKILSELEKKLGK